MDSAGASKGNDWQSQPRDPETGRFRRRGDEPRTEMIYIRLTPRERRQIEETASALGVTLTNFLVFSALGERTEAEQRTATEPVKGREATVYGRSRRRRPLTGSEPSG